MDDGGEEEFVVSVQWCCLHKVQVVQTVVRMEEFQMTCELVHLQRGKIKAASAEARLLLSGANARWREEIGGTVRNQRFQQSPKHPSRTDLCYICLLEGDTPGGERRITNDCRLIGCCSLPARTGRHRTQLARRQSHTTTAHSTFVDDAADNDDAVGIHRLMLSCRPIEQQATKRQASRGTTMSQHDKLTQHRPDLEYRVSPFEATTCCTIPSLSGFVVPLERRWIS